MPVRGRPRQQGGAVMMRGPVSAVLAAALGIAGCGGGHGGDGGPSLPTFFRLDATAFAQQNDLTVNCGIDFLVDISGEISRTPTVVEYIATMGGQAQRSLLRPDGSGIAFSADAFYPRLQVLHLLPNRVQLVSLDNPPGSPPSGSRFWDELRLFDGFLNADGTIEGEWVCAPLDTAQGGITDDTVFAGGSWETVVLTN